jgi:hypothetical protein
METGIAGSLRIKSCSGAKLFYANRTYGKFFASERCFDIVFEVYFLIECTESKAVGSGGREGHIRR